MLTGFRVGGAGWRGREDRDEGWAPDLLTFGKVVGGGLPRAAVAGRAAVMDLLAPSGPVYQAGTPSGNPTASAAGLATLAHCTPDTFRTLDDNAALVAGIVDTALTSAGVPHRVQSAGSLFSVFFRAEAVTDYASAKAFEAWFVSSALTDDDLALITSAAAVAASA